MIANITETLAIYASTAVGIEKQLNAPVFSMGEYNRLVQLGIDVNKEQRNRKERVLARADHHNKKIEELVMKLLPESNKLWDLVRNNERIFGVSSPEYKRAVKEARFVEEHLQLAHELYVNV